MSLTPEQVVSTAEMIGETPDATKSALDGLARLYDADDLAAIEAKIVADLAVYAEVRDDNLKVSGNVDLDAERDRLGGDPQREGGGDQGADDQQRQAGRPPTEERAHAKRSFSKNDVSALPGARFAEKPDNAPQTRMTGRKFARAGTLMLYRGGPAETRAERAAGSARAAGPLA